MRRWIGYALTALVLAGIGLLVWQLDFGSWQRLDLKRIRELPETTLVYSADNQPAGTLYASENRRFVPLSEIPERVVSAFIAAEDQRFYEHGGVDVHRILGALWHDIKTLSLEQGASTITQQLIKLTHLTSAKTLSRKVQEIVLARKLERELSKDEILEAYLNVVYFGSGAYGIETAAQTYFGKSASELTLSEGALLAGVIKSPSRYAPHTNPENAVKRRNIVLGSMLSAGMISEAERKSASAETLRLAENAGGVQASSWYLDQVLNETEAALHLTTEEILSSGLRIYTGLDAQVQRATDALFENGANFPDPATDSTPAQAALVALRPGSGEICAVAGGRSYDVRRGLNRATQMRRQPGSAVKPVSTYAAAIEKHGFLPTSFVQDVVREFSGGYKPGNAGGKVYGTVTLREALSRSLNIATVDLADLIGMDAVRAAMRRFGLPLSARDVNLSLALGAMTHGVSPAELGSAYCALINGGTRVRAHAVRRITDAQGRVLYEAETPSSRAVSPETAFLVTDMLKTAAASGSARALSQAGVPVMGKTGTVAEPAGGTRDIWTVAGTPEIAVAVWMGFDEPDADHALPDSAGGSGYPARLCAALLKSLSLSGADFAAPDTLKPAEIDSAALTQLHAVQLAAENTPEAFRQTEWFDGDRLPVEVSALWQTPEAVTDLKLLTGEGKAPALAFTARSAAADYLILRRTGEETEIVASVQAEAGSVIVWSDPEAPLNEEHSYSVIPRHRLLYESGTLLTGAESPAVHYSPGGLLNHLFGTEGEDSGSP